MSELIFATEGNPVPDRMVAGRLTMRDGKAIRWARFAAGARPLKGTVVVIPGRNECIEKYFETVRDLSDRGLGSLIFDLRGQGGSDRLLADPARGHVRSVDDYVGDLEQIFEQLVLPDCPGPYYVLAHSTGGLVALLAAPDLINRVRRMVLTAPLIEFAGLPLSMKWVRRLSGLMRYLGLGSRYFGGGPRQQTPQPFSTNKLTTDHARYERNVAIFREHPELAIGGPTAAWVHAVCVAVDRLQDPDFLARIHVPVLVVAAGADEVVSTLAAERMAERIRSGSIITIDGARHELLQEADLYREQVLAAFDAFVPGSDAPFS
ncbi:MAG: alpha/beta hydrolase [Rhizobiales bacterium]|nr:alpha/beta hydrolase [Hyphomicrobiales bacterium]